MGQRSQVFIHTITAPIMKIVEGQKLSDSQRWRDKMDEYVKLKTELNKFKELFGNRPETLRLGYHNQFMYGRSFVLTAIRLLEFNSLSNECGNPFNKEFEGRNINIISDWMKFVDNLLNISCDPLSAYSRGGLDSFWNLNYRDEPEVNNTPLNGDNNDGILILDLVHNKYCFMNIGEGDSTVKQLPALVPCTAKKYLEAYYPVEMTDNFKEDCEYHKHSEEKAAEILILNNKVNQLFLDRIDKFQVLTMEELGLIYPQVFSSEKVTS